MKTEGIERKSQQRRTRKNGQWNKSGKRDCGGLETKCKGYIEEKGGIHLCQNAAINQVEE